MDISVFVLWSYLSDVCFYYFPLLSGRKIPQHVILVRLHGYLSAREFLVPYSGYIS